MVTDDEMEKMMNRVERLISIVERVVESLEKMEERIGALELHAVEERAMARQGEAS